MRLTIIPIDGAVYKDQVVRELDLSGCGIPQEVHALQWYETHGEIEFSSAPGEPRQANQVIQELPQWALNCVEAWEAMIPVEPPTPPQPSDVVTE